MDWVLGMPMDEEAGWKEGAMNDAICQDLADVLPPGSLPLPSPPQADPAVVVEEADRAISGWKDARRNVTVHLPEGKVVRATNPDGSLVTVPIQWEDRPAREGIALDHRTSGVEHVMIINRQAQHIGWSGCTVNQFAALAGPVAPPAVAEEPSEVDLNA
jgi:hypothetical protein